MTEQQILNIFKQESGYLQGHFQLTSGLHSKGYMQCALVLQNPKNAELFGAAIAELYKDKNISCVVGPAMGGVIIAHETARALGVRSVFTERKDGKMTLRRGFHLEKDENIIIIEDVITTGGSVVEVIELLSSYNVKTIGVSSIIDRSNGKAVFSVPYKSLAQIEIEVFNPEQCPLCKDNIPIDKPGSRK